MSNLNYNKDAYPTLSRFHASRAYFRNVIGAAGSGKTFACCWEILIKAIEQAPDSDGRRRTRALVVRNTLDLLVSATVPTVREAWGELIDKYGSFTAHPNPKINIEMPLDDGTTVYLDILFRSFGSEDATRRALGVEYTILYIDEISEFSESTVLDVMRRAGRYPENPSWYGIISATNGCYVDHFTYKYAHGESVDQVEALSNYIKHDKFYEQFQQPPALIEPSYAWDSRPIVVSDWKENPLAENIDHIVGGYSYYYSQLTSHPFKIRAYVLGTYSARVVGKVVYPSFSRKLHVISNDIIDRSRLTRVYLGFDFGRTPCCVIAADYNGGLLVTDEIITQDCSITELINDRLFPVLRESYPNAQIEWGTGDPSGETKGQGVSDSPISIIKRNKTHWRDANSGNRIGDRIESVRTALATLGTGGSPKLSVCERCDVLTSGFETYYVYESNDSPTKKHPVSDIQDALQYLCQVYFNSQRSNDVINSIIKRSKHKQPVSTKWL